MKSGICARRCKEIMARLNIQYRVRSPFFAFRDRTEAGRALVAYMKPKPEPDALVLGLPRGGVAVGAPLADAVGAPLEPLVVRKLPIPISPEMGFGAVAIDGTRVLNDRAVASFGLTDEVINRITDDVMAEVRRRATEYVGSDRPPDIEGKDVYIVDDGLATGFTAIVGARMARRHKPSSLTLAVPVSPADSIAAVENLFDEVYCLYVQESYSFAVASFYRDFHDMTDAEVQRFLAAQGEGGGRAGYART
jgi:putative phosphoribosyl transferase